MHGGGQLPAARVRSEHRLEERRDAQRRVALVQVVADAAHADHAPDSARGHPLGGQVAGRERHQGGQVRARGVPQQAQPLRVCPILCRMAIAPTDRQRHVLHVCGMLHRRRQPVIHVHRHEPLVGEAVPDRRVLRLVANTPAAAVDDHDQGRGRGGSWPEDVQTLLRMRPIRHVEHPPRSVRGLHPSWPRVVVTGRSPRTREAGSFRGSLHEAPPRGVGGARGHRARGMRADRPRPRRGPALAAVFTGVGPEA